MYSSWIVSGLLYERNTGFDLILVEFVIGGWIAGVGSCGLFRLALAGNLSYHTESGGSTSGITTRGVTALAKSTTHPQYSTDNYTVRAGLLLPPARHPLKLPA